MLLRGLHSSDQISRTILCTAADSKLAGRKISFSLNFHRFREGRDLLKLLDWYVSVQLCAGKFGVTDQGDVIQQ